MIDGPPLFLGWATIRCQILVKKSPQIHEIIRKKILYIFKSQINLEKSVQILIMTVLYYKLKVQNNTGSDYVDDETRTDIDHTEVRSQAGVLVASQQHHPDM